MTQAATLLLFGEQHDLPLVRALGMKVRNVLLERTPQGGLPKQNEPRKKVLL
jgi:hypothetical protein